MSNQPYERIFPQRADSRLLFVCDHASNALPANYGRLGLPPELFETHIAADIGAAAVTGALTTAVLFTLGRLAIGAYLGRSATASAYAAAGSVLVLLLWLYYSAQIFLFGAEFTWVHAKHRQGRRRAMPREPAVYQSPG